MDRFPIPVVRTKTKRFANLAGGRGVRLDTGPVYCVLAMVKHLVIPETVESMIDIAVASKATSVVIHHLIPAQTAVNATLAEALFASLKTLWSTNLATHCAPSATFTGVRMRDLRGPGLALVSSTGAPASGTAPTGEALPRQIAACLTVRTNRAGKSFRGRMYWTGFAEQANAADNHIATTTKTALDTFAANFIAAANVSGLIFGVAHRPTAYDEVSGLPISPGLGFTTPATQVICRDNVWDTQRRRAS